MSLLNSLKSTAHPVKSPPLSLEKLRTRIQEWAAGKSLNRCQAPATTPGWMLANREPKSVPGTWCDGAQIGARLDASKPGAQIGASKEDGDARPRRAMLRRADARPRRAMLRRWLASCA